MTAVKIKWKASDKLIREELIRDGKSQGRNRCLVVNLEDLLPATRERILNITEIGDSSDQMGNINLNDITLDNLPIFDPCGSYFLSQTPVCLDAEPSLDQALAMATRIHSAWLEARMFCEKIRTEMAEKEAKEKQEKTAFEKSTSALGVTHAAGDLDGIKQDPISSQPLTVDNQQQSRNQISRLMAEIQEEVEEQRLQGEWIMQFGSLSLRDTFERKGNWLDAYLIERAAKDAPGFIIDITNTSEWSECDRPTDEALDEANRADTLGLGEACIVWLTTMPNDEQDFGGYVLYENGYAPDMDIYDEYSESQSGPSEAIVIRNYLGKYDLVKPKDNWGNPEDDIVF